MHGAEVIVYVIAALILGLVMGSVIQHDVDCLKLDQLVQDLRQHKTTVPRPLKTEPAATYGVVYSHSLICGGD